MMKARLIHALSLLFVMLGAIAQDKSQPIPETLPVATEIRRIPLKNLGAPSTIPLRTTEGSATISFGSRRDELVTKASLKLQFTPSPALLPGLSHIKLILNEELIGIVPINKEMLGRSNTVEVSIDPRYIVDFNRLRLSFIGHYTNECEDPLHTSLWTEVSGSASELILSVQQLPIRTELSFLPEPFFDQRDQRRLNLPFVFAAKPGYDTLAAAAGVSSWFGKLAAWRGARFSAHLNTLPKGNAIVFATNADRPDFLREHPLFDAPRIELLTNPVDKDAKILLISGRDEQEVKQAANGLVLGNAALSGMRAIVRGSQTLTTRQPYDAPNWVRVDRPMKFGELIDSPLNLQVNGHLPETIRIPLRIPPDLFTWESRGVPIDLKFRYTPPIRISGSRLTMGVNDELVQAFNLRESGHGADNNRVRLPLLDDGLLSETREVFIPAFKLGARNELQLNFSFTPSKEGHCKDTTIENVRAMVDADSLVDFSGFPHYAELPHIGYFASSGFPFTKYADLSQTVAILPESPSIQDIATFLTLMGHMGESTGYPVTQLRVSPPSNLEKFHNADLLLIGSTKNQPLLERWKEHLPASLLGEARRIALPKKSVSKLFDWLGFDTAPDPSVATQTTLESTGALAAILGFESPLNSQRSVVVVTAATPDDYDSVLDALDNPGLTRSMRGSTVFVHPNKVESFLVGDTYFVGHLPLWTRIWHALSVHPLVLAILAVLAILIFSFALWRTLKTVTEQRLRRKEE